MPQQRCIPRLQDQQHCLAWMVLPLQLKMYTVCLGSVCSITISWLPTCTVQVAGQRV